MESPYLRHPWLPIEARWVLWQWYWTPVVVWTVFFFRGFPFSSFFVFFLGGRSRGTRGTRLFCVHDGHVLRQVGTDQCEIFQAHRETLQRDVGGGTTVFCGRSLWRFLSFAR